MIINRKDAKIAKGIIMLFFCAFAVQKDALASLLCVRKIPKWYDDLKKISSIWY